MKLHRFISLATLLLSPAFAQTNTFPASGNVGIGTTTPQNPLQIFGPFTPGYMQISLHATGSDDRTGLSFWSTSGSRVGVINTSGDGTFIFGKDGPGPYRFFSNSDERLRIEANGNVGIGTTNPAKRLEVQGNLRVDRLTIRDDSLEEQSTDQDDVSVVANYYGYAGGASRYRSFTVYNGKGGSIFHVRGSTGNVGIGTTNPQHKLAVNGTIKAKEVIVETTGWSDYVFADDYRLAPLAEVEAHIAEKKHLPGMPSAAEVTEHGINVAQVQAALLAKVEELTLHLIAQEKTLRELKAENIELKTEINAIKQR